jgi:hypothetical protein
MLVISLSKLIGVSLGLYISVASATPILESRVVAQPNLCGGSTWRRRECVTYITPQTWRDICSPPAYPNVESQVYSSCPPNTVCENIVDDDGDRSIKCVNIEKPGQTSTLNTKTDPQIGTSVVKEGSVSAELGVEVTIQNDILASVAAVVLS